MNISYLLLFLNGGLLFCSFLGLVVFMFLKNKKAKASWEAFSIKADELPPGVFILPPGAKDPSQRKKKFH